MSAKRRGSKESRARLTLRKEVLRNLSADELAAAGGGGDLIAWLLTGGGFGICRQSQIPS